MWTRNEAKRTEYNGIWYRSALEAEVAHQLNVLGVRLWEYELPYQQIAGINSTVPYLPDFTIWHENCEPFHLPLWLEVKPGELLYSMRDYVQLPEHFTEPRRFSWSASAIKQTGFEEIWKPKQLAEDSGDSVLVVSAINRHRILSVLMAPEFVEFSKHHPAANFRHVKAEQEKAEQRRRWREDEERRRLERWQRVITTARAEGFAARFDGFCTLCHNRVSAAALVIYKEETGWAAVCKEHL